MDRWILESGTRDLGPGVRVPDPGTRFPGPRCRNLNLRGFFIQNKTYIAKFKTWKRRIWQISNHGLIFYWTRSLLVMNNLSYCFVEHYLYEPRRTQFSGQNVCEMQCQNAIQINSHGTPYEHFKQTHLKNQRQKRSAIKKKKRHSMKTWG